MQNVFVKKCIEMRRIAQWLLFLELHVGKKMQIFVVRNQNSFEKWSGSVYLFYLLSQSSLRQPMKIVPMSYREEVDKLSLISDWWINDFECRSVPETTSVQIWRKHPLWKCLCSIFQERQEGKARFTHFLLVNLD